MTQFAGVFKLNSKLFFGFLVGELPNKKFIEKLNGEIISILTTTHNKVANIDDNWVESIDIHGNKVRKNAINGMMETIIKCRF